MKTTIKVIIALLLIVGAANLLKYMKDNEWFDKADQVAEDMTGKSSFDKYLEVKEKADSFNLPAFRTGVVMFYTQNNRYPQSTRELEDSGVVASSVTRDQYGNRYDLEYRQEENLLLVTSPGKDEIKGTTDDVQYKIKL